MHRYVLIADLVSLILLSIIIWVSRLPFYAANIQVFAWISLKSLYFLYHQRRSGLASRNPQAFRASSGLYMLGVMVNVIALIVFRWSLASPLFLFLVTQIDWTIKGPYSWKYLALLFTVLSIVSDLFVWIWITNQSYWRWGNAFTLTLVNLYVISLIMIFVSWEALNIISDKPHAASRKYMGTDRSIKSPLLFIFFVLAVIVNVASIVLRRHDEMYKTWPFGLSGLSSIFLGLILPKRLTFHNVSLKILSFIFGTFDLLFWILSFIDRSLLSASLNLFVEIELIIFAICAWCIPNMKNISLLFHIFKFLVSSYSLIWIIFYIIDSRKKIDGLADLLSLSV